MSTAPKYPVDLGYSGLRMTADEYFALAETVDRYELINGVVIMSPSPTPRHRRIALLLALQIEQHAECSGGIQVIPDVDIRLSRERVCRPDIVAYRYSRLPSIPNRRTIPHDLVIEVLSPGSKPMDNITKHFVFGENEIIQTA